MKKKNILKEDKDLDVTLERFLNEAEFPVEVENRVLEDSANPQAGEPIGAFGNEATGDGAGEPDFGLEDEVKDGWTKDGGTKDGETLESNGETTDKKPEVLDPVEGLQAEIAQLKDRLMRSLADRENLRKRAERDRREAEVYGGHKLARDLLSVRDNMKRALETTTEEQRKNNKALIDGIELTERELLSAFANHDILLVAPQTGDKFDPNAHQAMFEAPSGDVPKGHIMQIMSEGFTIANRLLRPAQVGVSSGKIPEQ